ncbi:PLP-dependent aminotransferase family protein [Paraburkholderia sp. J12]|uniref:aminotransferase-like domain-containing protein n=1 Tax=Paraburkholderia sp. J12 TaxID=2805432 RepID=UPI002ABE6A21|nr:PLP-dependent aminotransferase family protein [Paraburkholderia sp. J12]
MTRTSSAESTGETLAWLSGFTPGAGPRYAQLATFIERAIATGALRPGDRLPPQRMLADLLGVNLTTVTRGLNEAHRRHLIESRGPLGTFVAPSRVELAQLVDLSMNIPPPPADVDLEALLRDGMSQVLIRSDIDLLMTYHLGGGSKADRHAGAQWLRPVIGAVDPAKVVVCPGAQSALAALILSATQAGDVILTEPLVYPGLPLVARQLGRRVECVATDADGMRPDMLEAACREHDARLLYLNPTLQNPTAATMPESRRLAIGAIAARFAVRIVEDDPYWRFAEDAPPPFARLVPQQTYYLSTLSKCLSPGLRTAYLVLPDAQSEAPFLASLRSLSLMATPLTTALVAQWMHDGSAAQLLAGVQAEARSRQQLARRILGGAAHAGSVKSTGSAGGIHVWHVLPDHWSANELTAFARSEGLVVAPASAFHSGRQAPNAVRISLGGCAGRSELTAALRKLADMLERRPHSDTAIVV